MIAEPTERPQLRERLMTPREVARFFTVEVDTIRDWVKAGYLETVRTPGGQLRFAPGAVVALYEKGRPPVVAPSSPVPAAPADDMAEVA